MLAALRGALGTSREEAAPTPDLDWRAGWAQLAELGIVGFCVPEALDGFGHQVDAAVVTARALGEALHGAPYAGLIAGSYLLAHADDGAATAMVGEILAGTKMIGFGQLHSTDRPTCRVDRSASADALVLINRAGDQMYVVDDPAGWVTDTTRSGLDVTRDVARVTIDLNRARQLPTAPGAADLHGLLLAADAVGCLESALARTVDYAKTRQSFGRPIGGLQSVQHRLADHAVTLRGLSLAVTHAAVELTTGSRSGARATTIAMVGVSNTATTIAHDLVQLTGAIGFTWEYGLHFVSRRVHEDARLAANPRAAIRTLVELEGWGA